MKPTITDFIESFEEVLGGASDQALEKFDKIFSDMSFPSPAMSREVIHQMYRSVIEERGYRKEVETHFGGRPNGEA